MWVLTACVACGLAWTSPDELRTYQEAAAKAGRDPESHIKLALWCEAHGLEAERLRHLGLAVLADPSNALARGLPGRPETPQLALPPRQRSHQLRIRQWRHGRLSSRSVQALCAESGVQASRAALSH